MASGPLARQYMLNAKPARGSPVSPWLESAPKSKVRSGAYHTSLRASARRIAAIVRSEKGSRNPRSNAGQPLAETQLGYCDPGHGLVQQVVSEDARAVAEARGDVTPRRPERGLEAPAVGRRVVRPEVVERPVERRHAQVVRGEALLGLGRKRARVADHRPVGQALALEALVIEVLVEVEQREDAVACERALAGRDAVDVALAIARPAARAGELRLEPLVDHPEADRVEAVAGEEAGVVLAEAGVGGR